MITYSVFRLAARRTVLCGWILRLECPPSPGLWALNAPGLLLVGHRGIPGGGLEPFAVPTRLSSGQHSLDLTIWPSRRNADGARAQVSPSRLAGASGLRGWNVAPGS